MDSTQLQQIEAYLSGQMTPEELSKFESLLEVNPELQQQLNFQTDVINGVGQFRKNELKARLEALDPTPAWWTIAHLSPVGQFIGGSVVVGALGIGTFFIVNPSNSDQTAVEVIEINAPTPVDVQAEIPEISPLPLVGNQPTVENTKITEELTKDERQLSGSNEEAFVPVVSVPEAGDVEAAQEFQPNDLPTPEESESDNSSIPVDVEIVSTKGSKVKYEYYAGKLYLYGKFQEEPYQILEINSASGRKVYLYHMDVFYHIEPVDKPTSLERVEDTDLIKELSILRKSK